MDEYYEVTFENTAVGKVTVQKQGLYCRVVCRCSVSGDRILRLYAMTKEGRQNLGVVVPEGESFVLDKKVPSKRLPEEGLRFELSAGAGTLEGIFVPIKPEEPFAYIDRLQDAFLEWEKGQMGIRIKEPRNVS